MERFWEIDFFRGIAVILMAIFNYSFALSYLGIYSPGWGFIFWWLFPRMIAGMFIFIAGISLSVSYARLKEKKGARRKYGLRGLKIFSLGMLITASTLLFVPSVAIFFGILHFIGAAIMLSPLYLRRRNNHLLAAAIASIAIGIYLQGMTAGFPWLLWLGIAPEFSTLDYFPVFPWIAIVLLGLYSGNTLYAKGRRRFEAPKQMKLAYPAVVLGRNSLLIYMLHIPVLMLILLLLGYGIF